MQIPIDLERGLHWARTATGRSAAALRRLFLQAGSLTAVLSMGPGEAARATGLAESIFAVLLGPSDGPRIAEDRRRLEAVEGRVITWFDDEYPPLLREVPDPPAVLFARGKPLSGRPAVAVVGSRAASRPGLEVARRLGSGLGRAGVAVISGFARGIDSAAHEGAIEASAETVAVLGCGLDVSYPRENEKLLPRLLHVGTAVSEFPPGTPPRPYNFPVRNRILAGMSLMTVVVEAREKSGSLITARLALEYGRDVGAVPGSVLNPASSGSNALLKDGAILVRDEKDVLSEIGAPGAARAGEPARTDQIPPGLDEDAVLLYRCLDPLEQKDADALVIETRLPAARLAAALVSLELEGLVQALPGAVFVRRQEKS
ncbi:MAG: DNA-protecting protein DprA [Acidobacteria bacterium]|nr:DNA-protecting protein DprA [Acidobacteriota bacterium]MCK6684881.1 DNA-processing protein DprA [Thermoanaerobaculia bacterium]